MVDLGLVAKVRPCLVLSIGFQQNERAVVTYVPRTTALRGGRFEVAHSGPRFLPGGFDVQSVNTVPVTKLLKFLVRLDDSVLHKVEDSLMVWLGMRGG